MFILTKIPTSGLGSLPRELIRGFQPFDIVLVTVTMVKRM
jgi:hypothetical protein